MTRLGRTAILSGVLLTLAAPPSPVPLLVFVALAPWAAAVAGAGSARGSVRRCARSGALLFAVHWGLLLLWVLRLAPRVGLWTIPAWLGQVALLALLGAGVGALLRLLADRTPLPLALALAWTAGEWIRGSALGPLDFPWMGIAVPLAGIPALVQAAAWVGERGVALAVAAVNGAVASGLSAAPEGRAVRRWGPAGLAAAAVVMAWIGGRARLSTLDPRPVLDALAVQPAVPLEVKRATDPMSALRALQSATALLPDTALTGVDLVVLPETAVPVPLDGPGARSLRAELSDRVRRWGVPLAVGAYGLEARGLTNAVFLVGPDPELPWPRADKHRLVPGVEWFPTGGGGLVAGTRPALLPVGGDTLAVLVCIESAGPEPARSLRARGAVALLNVTNDAWLGEVSRWSRTAAFWQHPAHLRLRSVETGAGALRVGNDGLTTTVDPGGRETVLMPPFLPGVARGRVTSLVSPTPFVRTGDLVGPLATLAGFVLALGGVLARRRGGREHSLRSG